MLPPPRFAVGLRHRDPTRRLICSTPTKNPCSRGSADADPGVRHGDRRRDERARPRRRGARASVPRRRVRVLPTSTGCSTRPALTARDLDADRGRHRPRQLHRAAHRPRDRARRSRSRSTSPSRASRRSTRSPPARPARVAGDRRAPARGLRAARPDEPGRGRPAGARARAGHALRRRRRACATATLLEAKGAEVPPDGDEPTCRARASTRCSRASSARRSRRAALPARPGRGRRAREVSAVGDASSSATSSSPT